MPSSALAYCLGSPTCPNKVPVGKRCHEHSAEQARHNFDVRRWYRTARWARLREQKQREDPLCVDCKVEGRFEPWTDLEHEVPHRGDPVLFWDPDNLKGRCHSHHSQKTKRGE